MIRAIRFLVVAAAIAGTGLFWSQPAAAGASAAPRTPIQHLVFMMQDHHSFDNYFGTRSGVDGLPRDVCMPINRTAPVPCIRPFPVRESGLIPTLNSSTAFLQAQVNSGRMDGFVSAHQRDDTQGRSPMGFYEPRDTPVIQQLADNGVLFDRWFSSSLTGSLQNRLLSVAAQGQPGGDVEVPTQGWGNIPLIFDRLEAANISWRIYVERYEPALTYRTAGEKARRGGQVGHVPALGIARYLDNPALAGHIVDMSQYYADLAAGRLPAVSYMASTASIEHPPADPAAGQRLVRNVVNALGRSTAWSSSAFLLTYDTSGGWYDHVVPPVVNGVEYGLRVPALLVSPYARGGTVDSTVLDHTAVLRFIEENWQLKPLTERDRNAGLITGAFDFRAAPQPAQLVGIKTFRPVQRPHTGRVYIGYAVAMGALGLAFAYALRPPRRATGTDLVSAT